MGTIRLDKYLANAGKGTRTEVKALIRRGAVTVDGVCVRSPEYKLEETAKVVLDGAPVGAPKSAYYLLHKPAGCVTAVRDSRFPVVMDLLKGVSDRDLAPVGRLDRDTEGLLLITNDGPLAHRLLSPKSHVPKTYFARVRGIVADEEIRAFARGLDIGDEKPALPAELTVLRTDHTLGESRVRIILCEGRFHQVKRMFRAVGMEVLYLKRLSMGSLVLPEDLPKGAFRPLTTEERDGLLKVLERTE